MLIIERDGRVEGRIEAPVIIVHGELEGTVLAAQTIEIWSGAKVAGDVAARSVRVDEGSMLTANLLIAADLPDRLGPPDPQSGPETGIRCRAGTCPGRHAACHGNTSGYADVAASLVPVAGASPQLSLRPRGRSAAAHVLQAFEGD